MKYRNIVVSGDVGTGTTTLAKSLAEKFGWNYQSAGDFFRQYSVENKIPLWNKEAVPDEIEKKVDNELVNKLATEQGWVIDGHYTGWFARNQKNVFKILLTCDRNVATQRMLVRPQSQTETAEEIEKRRSGLYDKFAKLYSSDNYEDPKFFDLVIDTTKNDIPTTLNTALSEIEKGPPQK